MPRINFLFWNLNKRPLLPLVQQLVHSHKIDVLILAECEIKIVDLLEGINRRPERMMSISSSDSNRLVFLTTLPANNFQRVQDGAGFAIRRLLFPFGGDLLMVATHLPSKLHRSNEEQSLLCTRIARHVRNAEERYGHTRSLVVGDLNMNPFEVGVVGSEGFHAVMSRSVAARGSRTVQFEDRVFFYNPMWTCFGRQSPHPQGTYYYDKGSAVNYYWNVFDQMLIRPALLPCFSDEDLHVIDRVGELLLVKEDGRPDPDAGSDHLPILFSLELSV